MKKEMKLKDYFALDFVNWLKNNCYYLMYDGDKPWGQYPEDNLSNFNENYSLKELLIKFKNENKLC